MGVAVGAVVVVWAAFILNVITPPLNFHTLGIRPREIRGLWGIIFWPLLHGGLPHLVANTAALFPLVLIAFSLSRTRGWVALVTVWLLGGLVVWTLGRTGTVHIGASGIVFGLIGFLVASGPFRREWLGLVVALIVLVCYGGALTTLLQRVPGVSWTAHAGGFVAGVFAAWETKGLARPK